MTFKDKVVILDLVMVTFNAVLPNLNVSLQVLNHALDKKLFGKTNSHF